MSESDADEVMLEIDGQEFSMAQIAGIDMGNVEEVRFTLTPEAFYQFRCTGTELTTRGSAAGAMFDLEILHAENMIGANVADWVGKTHSEFFMLGQDVVQDLGRIKAFLTDTGFNAQAGALQDLMNAFVGHTFLAKVTHRKDKNDKSIVYANISRKKGDIMPVAPHVAAANTGVAPAAPQAPQPEPAQQPATAPLNLG